MPASTNEHSSSAESLFSGTIYELMEDEMEFGIAILLGMFKPMNLKMLAKLLDAPESTALRKLRHLIEKGVVKLDHDATLEKRGKFYKLDPIIIKLLTEGNVPINDQVNQGLPGQARKFELVGNALVSLSGLNMVVTKLLRQFFLSLARNSAEILSKEMTAIASMIELSLESEADIDGFRQYYEEFLAKIKKYEKTPDSDPKWTHSLYVQLGPIGKLDLEDLLDQK